MALTDVLSGEKQLANFHSEHLLAMSPYSGRGKRSVWAALKRHESLMTSSPLKVPLPNAITMGIRFSTDESWRAHKHSSIACAFKFPLCPWLVLWTCHLTFVSTPECAPP